MKKILYSVFVVILCCVLLVSNTNVFAEDGGIQPDWEDISLTQEEINDILSNNINNEISMYATGLISFGKIAISKSGSKLVIVGTTECVPSVVKCGFKKVVVQRKTPSSSTWSNYLTYEDLYIDAAVYLLSKSVTVPSGYQYRVTCVHYAKKNILSTQTIDNTSNIVTF